MRDTTLYCAHYDGGTLIIALLIVKVEEAKVAAEKARVRQEEEVYGHGSIWIDARGRGMHSDSSSSSSSWWQGRG